MEDIDTFLNATARFYDDPHDLPVLYGTDCSRFRGDANAVDQHGCAMRLMALEAAPA